MAKNPDTTDVAENADIADLPYEAARDELAAIVGQLESGAVSLEESMTLWRRGEALAAHCEGWLAKAEAHIAEATGSEVNDGGGKPQ